MLNAITLPSDVATKACTQSDALHSRAFFHNRNSRIQSHYNYNSTQTMRIAHVFKIANSYFIFQCPFFAVRAQYIIFSEWISLAINNDVSSRLVAESHSCSVFSLSVPVAIDQRDRNKIVPSSDTGSLCDQISKTYRRLIIVQSKCHDWHVENSKRI